MPALGLCDHCHEANARLKSAGVGAVFHYVPLHASPAGRRFGHGDDLPITDDVADRLVRMPLWPGLEDQLDHVLAAAEDALLAG